MTPDTISAAGDTSDDQVAPRTAIPLQKLGLNVVWVTTGFLRFLLLLLPLIALPLNGYGWEIKSKTDSMTDEVRQSAVTRNAQGFELSFYRITPGGQVWANFSLPTDNLEVLGTRAPMYRIDQLKPVDLDANRTLAIRGISDMVSREPKWINFLVWHGKGQPLTGTLRDFMEGRKVTFRFYLATGGSKETTFDLGGAKEAIAQAIGVEADPDPEAVAEEKERKAATARAMDRCNQEFSGIDKQAMLNRINCMQEAAKAAAEAEKAAR
ncbi:hypothetical protein SAMN04488595_1326 [Ralstonia sp. 25mfcol4.1]|uniref:hypothetical protein n=1 Tax=Ralstonia sp. 25mfcol4.1 TaxID=1761899 RepID=UPI00088F41A3|nr:hypothetical protein [Ralstonia sp. 25mfcol4.1]SDP82511.1 hypothetical protein SAMN04488595_1326 [Ralstonia sp. 25mfcol4.1]